MNALLYAPQCMTTIEMFLSRTRFKGNYTEFSEQTCQLERGCTCLLDGACRETDDKRTPLPCNAFERICSCTND